MTNNKEKKKTDGSIANRARDLTHQYARRLRETGDLEEGALRKAKELITVLSEVKNAMAFTEAWDSREQMLRDVMENPNRFDHLSRDGNYNQTGVFFTRGLISPKLKERIREIQPVWKRVDSSVRERGWKSSMLVRRRIQKANLRDAIAGAAVELRRLKSKQRTRTQKVRTRARVGRR